MKQKLLNLLTLVESLATKAYAAAPSLCGVAVGYIFKPEIKVILDAAIGLVKETIKLL